MKSPKRFGVLGIFIWRRWIQNKFRKISFSRTTSRRLTPNRLLVDCTSGRLPPNRLLVDCTNRRLIAGIIIAVVLGLNVIGSLVRALESLIHDGDFASYLLVNSIMTIRDFNEPGELIHVRIVAAIYFIVFAIIAIRFKIKEDLH